MLRNQANLHKNPRLKDTAQKHLTYTNQNYKVTSRQKYLFGSLSYYTPHNLSMGNCMSSTSTEKPSQTTKRTTQTVQRPNNNASLKKPTTTTNNSTNSKPTKNQKPLRNAAGHKLSDSTTSSDPAIQILSPKEAAAKAAEERSKKLSQGQGKLGSKLEQERKKSSRKHLAEESEKVIQMKKVNELVYD